MSMHRYVELNVWLNFSNFFRQKISPTFYSFSEPKANKAKSMLLFVGRIGSDETLVGLQWQTIQINISNLNNNNHR